MERIWIGLRKHCLTLWILLVSSSFRTQMNPTMLYSWNTSIQIKKKSRHFQHTLYCKFPFNGIIKQLCRICWSGNQWNNGSGTVGNKKGRHIVSLWRELECLNKLDIIRHMSNILGFQKQSPALISKGRSSIIHGKNNPSNQK